MGVYDLIDRPDLKFKIHTPKIPDGYEHPEFIFDNIARKRASPPPTLMTASFHL